MSVVRDGRITQWAAVDGVGRVTLDSGEVVRFGASACAGFVPAEGLGVRVTALAPHPLGGQRATAMQLLDPAQGDAKQDQLDPLPLSGLAEFVELTDDVGLLGIVVREPMRARAALRAWFERAGQTIDFQNARAPLLRCGGLSFRVWACMEPAGGGQGVISFAMNTPFSIARERSLAARGVQHPELLAAVRALATGEVAVIAHQARGFLVPADEWRERADVRAWVRTATTRQNELTTTGMAALLMPDVFVRTARPGGEARLLAAAEALAQSGVVPRPGDVLAGAVVEAADVEWVRLADGA